MNAYLDRLEAQFSELSSRISHLEPISDQPHRFAELDKELVAHVAEIRAHYTACREIEKLQDEGQRLDESINSILVQLDDCRKQLEKPVAAPPANTLVSKVNAQTLLDYATKITRFTRKMPGSVDPTILPWPAEDQLRRGMLATYAIQHEQAQHAQHAQQEAQHDTAKHDTAEHDTAEHDEHAAQPKPADTQVPPVQAEPGSNKEKQGTAEPPEKRPAQRPKQKISLDFDSDDD